MQLGRIERLAGDPEEPVVLRSAADRRNQGDFRLRRRPDGPPKRTQR